MYTDGWHCSGDWFMCGAMWCWGKSMFVLCDASISVDLAGFKACKQAQSCWCALSTKSNKRTEDHWLFSECLFYWTGVILFSLQMWSFVKMSFSTTAFTPVQKLITYEFILIRSGSSRSKMPTNVKERRSFVQSSLPDISIWVHLYDTLFSAVKHRLTLLSTFWHYSWLQQAEQSGFGCCNHAPCSYWGL